MEATLDHRVLRHGSPKEAFGRCEATLRPSHLDLLRFKSSFIILPEQGEELPETGLGRPTSEEHGHSASKFNADRH